MAKSELAALAFQKLKDAGLLDDPEFVSETDSDGKAEATASTRRVAKRR